MFDGINKKVEAELSGRLEEANQLLVKPKKDNNQLNGLLEQLKDEVVVKASNTRTLIEKIKRINKVNQLIAQATELDSKLEVIENASVYLVQNTDKWTNEDVILTLNTDEAIDELELSYSFFKKIEEELIPLNHNEKSITISENGQYIVQINYGNEVVRTVEKEVINIDRVKPSVSNVEISPVIKGNIGGEITITFDLEDESGINLEKTYVMFADGPGTSIQKKESTKMKPVPISGNRYKVEVNTIEFVKANWTGKYNLQFTMYDNAGNHTSAKPKDFRNILIDNDGPSAKLVNPNEKHIRGTVRFEYEIIDNTGVKSAWMELKGNQTKRYELVFDNKTENIWYTEVDTTELSSGTYSIDVRPIDDFGKAKYHSKMATIVIDNEPPSKPTISARDGYVEGTWTNKTVILDFNSTDDVTDSSELIYEYNTSPILHPDKWRKVSNQMVFDTDIHNNAYVRAIDEAGNISEYSKVFNVKVDKTAPTVTVNGVEKRELEVKRDEYVEFGSTSHDNYPRDSKLTYSIKYEECDNNMANCVEVSKIDNTKVTKYKVTYSYTDQAGNIGEGIRQVVVQDTTAPVLTLNKGNNILRDFMEVNIGFGRTYLTKKYTVTDNYDPNVNVEIKPLYSYETYTMKECLVNNVIKCINPKNWGDVKYTLTFATGINYIATDAFGNQDFKTYNFAIPQLVNTDRVVVNNELNEELTEVLE